MRAAADEHFSRKLPFVGFKNRCVHKDGHVILVEKNGTPILDGQGVLLGYRGVDFDITERERAEASLQESERRYRQLLEAEPDAIFLIDNADGRILTVNGAASSLYGYTAEEFARMRNVDVSDNPEETRFATETKHPENFVRIPLRMHRKKDGTVFPVAIVG